MVAAGQIVVVHITDVATSAESPLAGAAQHNSLNLCVAFPVLQLAVQHTNHLQVERIEPGRAIEGELADMAAAFDQYQLCGCLRHEHLHQAVLGTTEAGRTAGRRARAALGRVAV